MKLTTEHLVANHLGDGSHAHYAVLMTPAAHRQPVALAFAVYHTLRDMLAVQPDVLPTKVTWWHEELARLRSGSAVHPLLQGLVESADEATCDALDALLHGVVMDANRIEVTDDNFKDYARLRCGALQQLLGSLTGTGVTDNAVDIFGRVTTLANLLVEAREPAFAQRANATLTFDAAADDAQVLSALGQRFEEASGQIDAVLQPGTSVSVPGTVWTLLARARWPLAVDAPPGQVVPDLSAWRRLLISWRAARRARPLTGAHQ